MTTTHPTVVETTEYAVRMPDGTEREAKLDTRDTEQTHLRVTGRLAVSVKLKDGLVTDQSAERVNKRLAESHSEDLAALHAVHDSAVMPHLISRRVITITDPWSTVQPIDSF
jgi:hypothetical protein